MPSRHLWAVSVKAVIFDPAGRILYLKKCIHDRRWELPGGHLDDATDTPEKALHRELREELGWSSIAVGGLLSGQLAEPLPPYPDIFYLLYEVGAPNEPIALSEEHEAAAYLDALQIQALAQSGEFNPVLARAAVDVLLG